MNVIVLLSELESWESRERQKKMVKSSAVDTEAMLRIRCATISPMRFCFRSLNYL